MEETNKENYSEGEISSEGKRKENERKEQIIRSFKREFLGGRYEDACISKIGKNLDLECQKVLHKWTKKPDSFFVFLGNAGIGKTYVVAALIDWAFRSFNTRRFYHERDIQSECREIATGNSHIKGDWIEHLKHKVDDQLIMMDDVGSQDVTPFREDVLLNFVDFRYKDRLPTIIVSNLSKKDFQELYHRRVASRLFATENTVIEIMDGKDLREQGY